MEDGDVISADQGLDIADDLGIYGAHLKIPNFTRGKRQLGMQEVKCSKKLSKVCLPTLWVGDTCRSYKEQVHNS